MVSANLEIGPKNGFSISIDFMDILSAAQQQINDAAKTFDPNPSSGSAPPPPNQPTPTTTPTPPSLLKEEAILPSPQEGAATTSTLTSPTPAPIADAPLPPPPPPVFEPSMPDGDTTQTFGGPPPEDSWKNKVPPPQKKGMGKGVILAGLFLLLATLPVAVYYVSQQQKQLAEIRSRAATCYKAARAGFCPSGSHPEGPNCCVNAVGGGGTPPPTPTSPPSGGGGSTVGVPNGQISGCCSNNGDCVGWFGAGSTCDNLNGACASGKQCRGGANTGGNCHQCTQSDCGVPGCGGQTCNAGCVSPCGDGICGQNENSTTCPQDCRPTGGGATTCAAGKIICRKDNSSLCPNTHSSNPAYDAIVGVRCNGTSPGSNSACDFFDACGPATQASGSCAGKIRLSPGGASHGGFIGCNGTLNCFCGAPNNNTPRGGAYTAANGTVSCFSDTDPNNPSCGASLGGTTPPPPPPPPGSNPPPPPPPPPPAGQCVRIKVYKNSIAVDPTTLKVGDSVTLAVSGTNATKGRIRVNGAAFVESTTLNTNGEYTVPFTVPSGFSSFTIEAEVFGSNGQWQ